MGRRSINTTKSGKYMNPTDQARKEARKKELKKNKKQRQLVRAAVLKGKDPAQLIEEMEKIDEMEYNVLQPSPLNEKVLREKRKKLKETFDRVMRLYHNDDPDLWAELKRREVEYERRRNKKVQYFESVRHAQTVQIDDIPLPDMTEQLPAPAAAPAPFSNIIGRMPADFQPQIAPPSLPPFASHNNNKNSLEQQKSAADDSNSGDSKKKEPPGCPPGPPPSLLSMRDLDSDYESSDDSNDGRQSPVSKKVRRYSSDRDSSDQSDEGSDDSENEIPKPTSVQQSLLAIAGQKYDDFMKELENVHKKKDRDRPNSGSDERQSSAQDNIDKRDDSDNDSDDDSSHRSKSPNQKSEDEDSMTHENKQPYDEVAMQRRDNPASIPNISSVPAPPMPPPILKLPTRPPPPMGMPPSMMFRPPPMRPGLQSLGMRMPSGPNMMRMRLPPPPPGMPPRLMHPNNKFNSPHSMPMHLNPAAQPQLAKDTTKGMTTITAKPQIRNLSADVTRFVPSALRVKREDKKVQKPKSFMSDYSRQQQSEAITAKGITKDDAYMQFMKEMQGLL